MKTILYTAAVLVSISSLVQAQSAPNAAPHPKKQHPEEEAPPIKMGLWQNTIVSNVQIQLPPEVVERMKAAGRPIPGAAPRTTVTQGCLTPDKWQESWQRAQSGEDCHTKNLKVEASGLSADIDCKDDESTSTGHMQVTFISSEKTHGTMHMQVTTTRSPQPIVMDITMDSVFQGSDCKGISPDKAQVVSH